MTPSITSAERQSYDPSHFALLRQVEDEHFWFTTRNRLILKIARQALGPGEGFRLLEIGCGNGNVLRWLRPAFAGSTVVGMDLFSEGLQLARHRTDAPLVLGDAHNAPFSQSFDLLGMFDVLEHLEDDLGILRAAGRLLRPGGTLLISVPAYRALWSHFDVAAHHCRRYEAAELQEKLEATGFSIQFLSPFMAALLPLLYISRKLRNPNANKGASDLAVEDLRIVPVLNPLLTWLLDCENQAIQRRIRLPFGTSLLAVATRQ